MEPGTGNVRLFTLPHLERVFAGQGCLESLASEIDRYGRARVVVVTGKTLASSPLISRITSQLGGRAVSVFGGARQHVPSGSVAALVAAVREHRADAILSVGGGSPIDTAKAAVHAMLGGGGEGAGGSRGAEGSTGAEGAEGAGGVEGLVHIAVPTTLSAGEFTDVAGITDETTRVKRAVYDVRLAPRTVIADPEATLETPGWLWAASGIRALDHAVETLYARHVHPISDAVAVRGLEMLVEHLPRSNDSNLLHHRSQCQLASWLAVFGLTNAGFGLSHLLGHQIGPRWNVAHGVTSAIVLPHAMRFMADAVPERFAPIARGLGVPFDGARSRASARACADHVEAFIRRFDLPTRLRDVGVPQSQVGEIAAHVVQVLGGNDLIGRPVTLADVTTLLAAAY